MATSRVFKAGNSQAVRIPQALAYDSSITEVEVERHGDTLIVRPQRMSMADLVAILEAQPVGGPLLERQVMDWPDRWTDEGADPADQSKQAS